MSDRPPLETVLRVNAVPFLAPSAARGLLRREEPLRLSVRQAAAVMSVGEDKAQRVLETARGFDVEGELRECERRGITLIQPGELGYPEGFRALDDDAPLLLYALGRAETPGAAAAVVGTRSATPYGLRLGRRLGHGLAAAGVCVVSGLARGIDTQAHEGALAAGGVTWAFLGSGLGRIYPPENEPLARRIAEQRGCLLSEYPLSASPDKQHFPRRNRLIAACGWATVIVESRDVELRRGAMDTAYRAHELGREVFAVPGPVDSPASDGPLKLLREGAAALACSAQDVLATLSPAARLAARCGSARPAAGVKAAGAAAASSEHQRVLGLLEAGTRTADQLAQEAGLDAPRLSNVLFELELQGDVVCVSGGRYARKDKL